MWSLPQPSDRTRELWGHHARHALRLEAFIFAICLLSLPFAITIAVQAYGDYEVNTVTRIDFPPPILTLALCTVNVYIFARRALHPVYTLCITIFLALIWAVVVIFCLYAGGSILSILTLCLVGLFSIVSLTYFVYMGFSAKAFHDLKVRRRQGVYGPNDGMGLQLVSKHAGVDGDGASFAFPLKASGSEA